MAPLDLRDWSASWNALDVFVNLAGFVPFGFLRRRLRSDVALGLVGVVGFSLSLAIELKQSLMPSRISSVQDLLLNALGALGGAAAVSMIATGRAWHSRRRDPGPRT